MSPRNPVTRGNPPRTASTAIKHELGQATDELNAAFAQVERRLRRLGIAGSIPFDVADPEDQDRHYVGFDKIGGVWRLTHITESGFGGQCAEGPLTSEPRWVRVAAASKLDALVRELQNRADEELKMVRAAIDDVNKVLQSLPEPDGQEDASEDDSDDDGDVPF